MEIGRFKRPQLLLFQAGHHGAVFWDSVLMPNPASAVLFVPNKVILLSFRLLAFLCRNNDTGDFLVKAEQLLHLKIDEAQMARLVSNPQYKLWKSAASAFYTTVNSTISSATPAEVCEVVRPLGFVFILTTSFDTDRTSELGR
jgi:hypothetical protein